MEERRVETVTVKEGYDRWSEVYEEDGNPLLPLDERHVPPLFGDLAGKDVLELACGTGRHTTKLVAGGARVTAMDFSAGMLALAKGRLGGKVKFVEGDLTEALPFGDASFDLVVCFLALEHVAHIDPLFAEVRRVLRPGQGAFVASDMHPAMRLRGNQASFDTADGTKVKVDGFEHPVATYVMAAVRAGLRVAEIAEHKGDATLAERHPRMQKYVGWPMLVTMRFVRDR